MPSMDANPNHPFLHSLARLDNLEVTSVRAQEFVELERSHEIAGTVETLMLFSHGISYLSGWHHDPVSGEPVDRNVGEMIALMHSELSEAMEAHRKGLMDDKLPHRLGIEVELADLLHRVFDFAGKHRLDIGGAYYEKALYNVTRDDHKPENRIKEGGKSY